MWLKQFLAVSRNAATIAVGDPFYLVLHIMLLVTVALLGAIPGFTFGEHIKLLRDQCMALLFMVSCLAVTFGSVRVFTDDIRRGTGPILFSRPIGASCLVIGKWAGVFVGVMLLGVSGLAAYLWISEVAHDAEYLNLASLSLYAVAVVFGLGAGGIRHYLFGGGYVRFANLILTALLAFFFLARIGMSGADVFDWAGLQSGAMLVFGVAAFSAVMVPIAIIADSALVLSIGVAVFFFGLVSSYLLSVASGSATLSAIAGAVLPNWQIYWIADRLGPEQSIPVGYYGVCGLHAVFSLIVYLTVAMIFYDRIEIREVV